MMLIVVVCNFNFQASRYADSLENAVWTNQFDNTANRQAHIETTGPEIWEQTGRPWNIQKRSAGVARGGKGHCSLNRKIWWGIGQVLTILILYWLSTIWTGWAIYQNLPTRSNRKRVLPWAEIVNKCRCVGTRVWKIFLKSRFLINWHVNEYAVNIPSINLNLHYIIHNE